LLDLKQQKSYSRQRDGWALEAGFSELN